MVAALENTFRRLARKPRDAMGTFWVLMLAIIVLDVICAFLSDWPLPWRLILTVAGIDLALGLPLMFPRYRDDARLRTSLVGVLGLLMFLAFGVFLSYLVVATSAPLVDTPLANADRALGFDNARALAALHRHPAIAFVLDLAYISGLVQVWVIVMLLGTLKQHARLGEFLLCFAVANLVTIAVSAWVPAAGPWVYYGTGTPEQLDSISHFEALRSGAIHAFPAARGQGLVSIPSMHAASALLFVHAVRGTRWLIPMGVLNFVMLLSTPMSGGHYIVDVVAGIALAMLVIVAVRLRHGERAVSLRGPTSIQLAPEGAQ